MQSRRSIRLWDSFKLRLALFSAGIFMLATLASFTFLYRSLAAALVDSVDESLRTEIKEFEDIYAAGGIEAIRSEIAFEEEANGANDVLMQVLDTRGTVIVSSDTSEWVPAELTTEVHSPLHTVRLATVQLAKDGSDARIIRSPLGSDYQVLLGYTLRDESALLQTFRNRFQQVLAVMLGLCALGAWVIAKRAMSGVEEVTRAAVQIASGDLDRRVHLTGQGFEIDRLVETFNAMLDRIAVLVGEIRQISDNIAHELRSPITRIRGHAEVTLMSDASREDYRELTGGIIEECDALLAMVNTMLDISELEGGIARLGSDEVDVSGLLDDTCELFQPAAEDEGVSLTCTPTDVANVRGDRRMLGQMLINLLDNAMKYTPRGGHIAASALIREGNVEITIEDSGIGIPADDIPHVFNRFYRGSNVSSKPGSGLGLGLVHAVVRAHEGVITVRSIENQGTAYRISFPLADAPSNPFVAGHGSSKDGRVRAIQTSLEQNARVRES